MRYRVKVKVDMLSSKGGTEGAWCSTPRDDMSFSVVVTNAGDIIPEARKHFKSKWGPDTIIKTCNLVDNGKSAVLHCIPANQVRNVVPINDIKNILKPMPMTQR